MVAKAPHQIRLTATADWLVRFKVYSGISKNKNLDEERVHSRKNYFFATLIGCVQRYHNINDENKTKE